MTSTSTGTAGAASHDNGEAAKALRYIPLGEQRNAENDAAATIADNLSRKQP